jgi:LuxR family maltose regulon positive regulatory protein
MPLTKLHIPPASQNIVHRQELYEKLNIGLTRKLILISAPAGFGKTTIISDWINQHKISTVWFSLDNGDNDPAVFLSYVISGIQSIHKEFGQSALQLLNSPNSPSVESITGLLINEILNIKQNFLLVLDDFHLIKSNEVLKLVTYLIEYIPGNIHIVILTRSDPAIAVSRLRSQNQLVELRSSDLSFSANDISVLFNKKLKLGLSIDDVYSLETKTEGWIAGLQLTALSMKGREDIPKFIKDFKGDNSYIMDYLVEEVLKIQTDDIKEFLIQTSILEQMSASLCNTVLNRNDSQLVLEKLDKNNMFVIPLDNERNWYRYHHLFADLLKQRLQLRGKEAVIELHNNACRGFEHAKMNDLAIEHALEINNYDKSIQLLCEMVEVMWENGHHSAIMKYGDLLPEGLIKKNPDFCLYYSWILITTGQIQKAEPLLVSAQKITKKIIDDKFSTKDIINLNSNLLGKISVALAYLNTFTMSSDKVLDYAKTAMKYLSKEDSLWLGWIWYSVGMAEMTKGNLKQGTIALQTSLENCKKSKNLYLISTVAAIIAYHEGKLGHYKASFKHCSDILKYMKANGYSQIAKTEWTYSGLFTMMSVVQCIWTDFDGALENVKTAYDLCKSQKNIGQKIIALLAYSYILYAREERTEALKRLAELEEVMKQYKVSPFSTTTYVGWKIRVFIDSGQLDEADNFAKECGLGPDKKISYKEEHSYIFYIRLLLAQNRFSEADSLLSDLYSQAYSGNWIETLVYLKILYALMYKMTGDKEKAVISLIEAMEFAADENMLYYFLFDLNFTNDLFIEVFKRNAAAKTNIPEKFIDNLKLALEKRNNFKKNNFKAIISTRELDTLKLIAQDLSNQEIADKLFISINTVKTHLKNINLKLGVESRVEAVTKAKELRLI